MSESKLDIAANRRTAKYSRGVMLARVTWAAAGPLFRWSPRPLFGWRRFLLRLFGAKIGRNVNIYASARITMPWNLEIGDWSSIGERAVVYNLGRVIIGRRATVSQQTHLCAGTHDYDDPSFALVTDPITICDEAWICADAFVGPGVEVGEGAIVAARAVTIGNVEPWSIVGGNPAREIKKRKRPRNSNEDA